MSVVQGAESLYLIDAFSLIFQVFHALPEMTGPTGLPTNAVFGFTKDLFYLENERKPTYLVCVFDAPGPTFRDSVDPNYKANRSPMPEDLSLQIPLICEVLEGFRIPKVERAGFEADDLIATLAVQGEKRGMDVFICSSDKDCRQLLSDKIRIFNIRKQEIYDSNSLINDWGIAPGQVIDFQTLVGDSVDNIKGVPGIGPKTATKLLQDYQTLDNLLAKIDTVQGKKKESIIAARDTIPKDKQLVALATDVPIETDWEKWRVRTVDAQRLLDVFRKCGFQRFQDQVKAMANGEAGAVLSRSERSTLAFYGTSGSYATSSDGLFARTCRSLTASAA